MTVHSEWCDLERAAGDAAACTCGADRTVVIGVEVRVSAGISNDEPIVGDAVAALGRALHKVDPTDRRWMVRLRGLPVWFDGYWNAYVGGERLGHNCMAFVPMPIGAGAWRELAIPDVTTWRCGCGREWVWQRGGWVRLADAGPDEKPVSAEEGKTIGGSFHQHALRHSHLGGDADHNHVQMAAEASDQTARVTAPRQFLEGIAPLLLLGYERLAPGDVEEGRYDRAVLAASLAEAVSAVDAAARRLRAAWRNVGGDAGNVEGGA